MKTSILNRSHAMNTKKFFSVLLATFLCFSNWTFVCAEEGGATNASGQSTANVYNFGPEGQPIESNENFGKPNQMVSIIPDRPIASHDKNGNMMFYTGDGKMTLSISKDGKRQFSIQTFTIDRNADGSVASTSQVEQGSNLTVQKNDQGQITGYQQMGLGGKQVAEYDNNMNLTKSYHYNAYGKSTLSVTDELTQTKTVFDSNGNPVCDIDYQGNEISHYTHDKNGVLQTKVDGYGNTTFFNKSGQMTSVQDSDGNTTTEFKYATDPSGRTYLSQAVDFMNKSVTNYDTIGRRLNVVNEQGAVTQDFHYAGANSTVLLYSFDYTSKQTTYYDVTGKETYTMKGDVLTQQWLYSSGKMVGKWDQASGTTIIYKNQSEEVSLETGGVPPSADMISEWVDAGMIEAIQEQYAGQSNTSGFAQPSSGGNKQNYFLSSKKPETAKNNSIIQNSISDTAN